MRIGINARMLTGPKLEGIGRYTWFITSAMTAQHPEVQFVLFLDRPLGAYFSFGDNVKTVILRPPARHPLLWKWWFDYSLSQALKKYDCDVFFSPETFTTLRSEIPQIITTHDLIYLKHPEWHQSVASFYWRRYCGRFHQKAQYINCISNATREDVVNMLQEPESKTFVAPNAPARGFAPLSSEAIARFKKRHQLTRPYILYVGSIHHRKNILTLINAFTILRDNNDIDAQLVLAGRPFTNYARILHQAITDSPYREDIVSLGFFEGDLNALINGAACLCYPSLAEGFGVPIIEAMAAGTPVVCANTAASREAGGDAALYFEAHDAELLQGQLAEIMFNPALQKQCINRGFLHAKKFSWEDSAATIFQYLCDLT